MKVKLIQGTPEWHAHRLAHNNASELAAAAGLSKYKSRSDMVREKATGIQEEIAPETQKRFDRGHEIEAISRTFAEEYLDLDIGQSLDPCVFSEVIDGVPLSASLDGLNMPIMWECKTLNADLKAALSMGEIPEPYMLQMEQGMMLSNAERCLFTASNGTREGTHHAWYSSRPDIRAKILPIWKQFAEDVKNYVHVEAEAKVVTGPVETLPAIFVTVEGRVADSNLPDFVRAAHEYIDRIQTDLVTDADFDTAAKNVNELESGEKRLEAVKANALAQTSSIDELFRAIDQIKGEMKKKRLHLADLVKTKKESRKIQIITEAKQAMVNHVMQLNQRIGGAWMPVFNDAPFAEAIKGLKSIDSMREKVGNALRNAMLDANMLADTIEANRKMVGNDMILIPDFAQVCTKTADDFANLFASRVHAHRVAEYARIEAERAKIRAEEQAKAEREAQAKARAEQAERDAEAARLAHELAERAKIRAEEQEKAERDAQAKARAEQAERDAEAARLAHELAEREAVKIEAEQAQGRAALAELITGIPVIESIQQVADVVTRSFPSIEEQKREPIDDGKTLKLGEIGARLGFSVTADFMAQLGFQPVATEKSAKLYRASDFGRICIAIINHIQSAMRSAQMAA
jgi:putative phage-type endonuclease